MHRLGGGGGGGMLIVNLRHYPLKLGQIYANLNITQFSWIKARLTLALPNLAESNQGKPQCYPI